MKRRWIAIPLFTIGLLAVSAFALLRGSYPRMDGEEILPGLAHPVSVQRDRLGILVVCGKTRADIARATGFLHAQERFFQMDLMRRMAAGEMSELVGDACLDLDKERRIHGFRKQAERMTALLSPAEKELIQAYTEGVNSGLRAFTSKPFEYFFLNTNPKPWTEADSFLVGLGLYFDLQDPLGDSDRTRGLLKASLPSDVYAFFVQNGSAWNAPLDQSSLSLLSIPSGDSFRYLEGPQNLADFEDPPPRARGSNQWAVQSSFSKEGQSLLACDMHLNLFVPNIWYRLGIETADLRIDGATLPGIPFIAAGSNRKIAWGFTNGYVDTTDLVVLDLDPADPNRYLAPEGSLPFETRMEEIRIKGKPSYFHPVLWTKWGPVHPKPLLGKPVAIRWIAHDLDAFNFRMLDLEAAASVKEAIEAASNIRLPVLNFMAADREGHIGWCFLGGIPKREGYEPGLPVSFTDGTKSWTGLRTDLPTLIDPPQGRLWTANNRVLDDPSLGSDQLNPIRAYQIQKRLFASDSLSLSDMIRLQLDDEAFFFHRWRDLLLSSLDPQSHQKIIAAVTQWDGRCAANSQGYYWIRTFREKVKTALLKKLLAPAFLQDPDLDLKVLDLEEPIYLIASQKPDYLCSPQDFHAFIDEMLAEQPNDISWGKINSALIQHPLSAAVPFLSFCLDMAKDPLHGDYYVPRLAGPSVGASLRIAVSPGHEEEGLFSMPCGQSGHPLSPHYRDQHAAWIKGSPAPFLPGPPLHSLQLIPAPKNTYAR